MLVCRTCGKDFVFTVREQDFFESKAFAEPRHCQECRAIRKRERMQGGAEGQPPPHPIPPPAPRGGSREWTEVVCAICGRPTSVPFKPTTGRPVFCRDCFAEQRRAGAPRTAPPPSSSQRSSAAPTDQVPHPDALPAPLPDQPEWIADPGPLPESDPAPDEEGEITVSQFVPFASGLEATPEETNPTFGEEVEEKHNNGEAGRGEA